MEKILKVSHMNVEFLHFTKGIFPHRLTVLKDVSFEVGKGEIIGLCGQSGAGKSIIASALLGILPPNTRIEGKIYYRDKEVGLHDFKKLRGKEISLVPQSVKALDPLMKIGKQLQNKNNIKIDLNELLKKFTLSKDILNMYPFQLSGGMAKKVLLMTAVTSGAQVIVADEPTTGIDEEALEKILQYLCALANEGKSIILITHDIQIALDICNRIYIIKEGTIIENAIIGKFAHPYTKALIRALPQNEFSL